MERRERHSTKREDDSDLPNGKIRSRYAGSLHSYQKRQRNCIQSVREGPLIHINFVVIAGEK